MGSTDPEAVLRGFLDALSTGTLPAYLDRPAPSPGTWPAQLRRLALTLSGRWAEALAEPDPGAGTDPAAAALGAAVTSWASAWDPGAGPAPTWSPNPAQHVFVRYVAAEGLLARGQVSAAATACADLPCGGDLLVDGRPHPFGAVVVACQARAAAFTGDLDAAERLLGAVEDDALPPVLAALHAGTGCFLAGNRAEQALARRLAARVDVLAPVPADHLSRGSHLLAAFGLVAVGEVAEAARHVLVAGGHDPDLGDLTVIDRALGLEMLVALAVEQGDPDAADAWAERVQPLLVSSAGDATAARALSRAALARGRVDEAVAWAEVAVDRAERAGRGIERSEAEIVLARARMQLPAGRTAIARSLADLVATAEERGHLAVRRSAARELRSAGLRMVPASGSAWAGLTEREREVAALVADGATNRQVARQLWVTENTVRVHVSRVLAAFGVATRAELPRAMAEVSSDGSPTPGRPAEVLTPRQREVAGLVAEGLTNAQIAERLGISAHTVHKHVASIMSRWGVSGRTAIAREVVAGSA